jgi:hypothetical protein
MTKRYKPKPLVILTGIIGLSVAGGPIAQNEAGPNQATNPGGVPIPTPTDFWQQIETLRKTDSGMAQTRPFHMGQSHSFQLGSRTVDWYTTDYANTPVISAEQLDGEGELHKRPETHRNYRDAEGYGLRPCRP